MIRVLLSAVLLAACAVAWPPVLKADDDVVIVPPVYDQELTGRIERINYETHMLFVKSYTDESMTTFREDNIYVLEDARIERKGQDLTIKDLQPGEEVTVEYRVTDEGAKEADHIWVQSAEQDEDQ
jgi:PDZ domain-containing secreted protein